MTLHEGFDGSFVMSGTGEKNAGGYRSRTVKTLRMVVCHCRDSVGKSEDFIERVSREAAAAHAHRRAVTAAKVGCSDFGNAPAVELTAVAELPIGIGKICKVFICSCGEMVNLTVGVQKCLADG